MFKKFYLIIFIIIFSNNVSASVWGDIAKCLDDPCNCGQSDRTEVWGAGTSHEVSRTFPTGQLCPPWNKNDGRSSDNCLLQYDYPDSFIVFYYERCAQATPNSTYFSPKINVRYQSCNGLACWSLSSDLNWDGQCVVWPTGYGLPLTRICARIAVPETPAAPGMNADPSPADPGYTKGKHLNNVGYIEDDDLIIGVDGKEITIVSPKLCAYSDPGLVNLVSDSGAHTDAMDWNPTNQPLHQTTELSPIAKVLAFLVKTLGNANLPTLLANLLDMMGSASDHGLLKVFKVIFKGISDVNSFFPDLIIAVIKVFGSLNSAVDSYSFGCVQLPMGPFPPPYCPSLNQVNVPPVLNNICTVKKSDGTFDQSSMVQPCVVSNVRNNIINNTVRVSFNNLVPLCIGATPDLTTCVQINNLDAFSSATGAHTATAYTDFVKPCSSSSDNAPCVNTQIPLSCSVTANGCNQGFRIVYSQVMGSYEAPSDYYISDIPDCGSGEAGNSASCQKVWGVNLGEFMDVSIKFPTIQKQMFNGSFPIQQIFSLVDNNGTTQNLYASISNNAGQTTDSICVFQSEDLINCVPRANSNYVLATYQCGAHAGLNCPDNTYYTPQFIASVQVRDSDDNILDETSGIATPLSYTANASSTATESIITLAGFDYSSSVAFIPSIPAKDPKDTYIAMPFSGPNSLNQFTIYGKYKNDVPPYDSKGNSNSDAVYLKYLEYINGKYIQGGTDACLMPRNFQHCSPLPSTPGGESSANNQVNCVLASLTNANTVDCQLFKTKASSYFNLGICQADVSSYTLKETVSGPGKGITIYSYDNEQHYCYTNNDNAGVPVCILSKDYQSRINPDKSLGPVLNDSQYYTVQFNSDTTPTYDQKTSDIRDKTFQELGLCSPITVPTCAAITNPTDKSGHALWPESDVGDLAQGTCPLNWVVIDPNKPLQRYCLSNFDTKTVAFEDLADGVGCRESKGLPVQIGNNNFPQILPDTPYDPKTKIGDFILNKIPIKSVYNDNDMAFPDDPETKIDASNEPGQTALYSITFNVILDAIMSDIDYFKVLDLWYDDCVLVTVNGQKLLSAPISTVDSLADQSSCNNGNDQGKALQATSLPIDIKPYLRQGNNTITFQLRVMRGGGLYFHMQYKMLR